MPKGVKCRVLPTAGKAKSRPAKHPSKATSTNDHCTTSTSCDVSESNISSESDMSEDGNKPEVININANEDSVPDREDNEAEISEYCAQRAMNMQLT